MHGFVCHLGLLVAIFISADSTAVVFACKRVCVRLCPHRDYCVGQSAEEPSSIYWVPQSPLGHTVRTQTHTHTRTDTSPSLDSHLSSQTRDSPQTH